MTPRDLLQPATLVAIAAGALLAASGMLDLVHAVLLPAVALVAHRLWQHLDDGAEASWPSPPAEHRHGARHDVSDLGWATFTRDGHVSDRVTRRVRAVAVHRLAQLGVDLANPDHRDTAADLLGSDVLHGIVSRRPPSARTLTRWLDALDRLPTAHQRTGRPTA